ncbi:polysaccharide biosynthesis/export family protein [Streptomyces phaeoluteigriseus]|uniref:Polysaccharide biosynthesis/export family protein n=1 Tax=Streptomyces phaeoluteigriseus TaxID=114686 RepID=A0ABY4Z8F6_9ACTN|nr:polysaccharide biosynthesis/export family protein [Streptomyces phaeoluteigriseus]USQ85312.1 polysaccharide biosynthesis/export family protein [Streptomyces phaeoluteigriseus]
MSTTSLELGEVVNVEVREASGAVTPFSHEYPVDASSLLRIPSLNMIVAAGKALQPDLRDEIHDRFVSDGVLSSLTVNVTPSSTLVDLENTIQPGETIFVRLLNTDGTIDSSSGSFPVDASGSIHMPFLGGVLLNNNRFFEAEHQIEQGLSDGGFFAQPLVNVTRTQLA